MKKERIASQCICCGGNKLKSSPAILMPFIAHRAFGWLPVNIDDGWGLKTIKNGHAYSICNSLFCEICTLLFLDIRFSKTEMNNLYKDYRGKDYTDLRDFYEPGYLVKNPLLYYPIDYMDVIEKFIQPYLKNKLTILDWGGDTGLNTPFNKSYIELDIFDISNKNVIEGAKLVNKKEAAAKKYSLVVCRGVLEHVPYPIDLLLDIKKSMDVSSVLFIQVPLENLRILFEDNLHVRKKHWHEHINFFSVKSLNHLLQNAGLHILNLKQIKVNHKGYTDPSFELLLACRIFAN